MKITAEETDLRPRIGRSRSLRHPWSRSMPFVRYRPVRCRTPGTAAASAGGYVAALSVMTRRGVVPLQAIARSKNLCAAARSRRRHIGVHYLAVLVDGAIDVVPAPANSGVRLVHPPVGTNRIAVLSGRLAK